MRRGERLRPPVIDPRFNRVATLSPGLPQMNRSGTVSERIVLWGALRTRAQVVFSYDASVPPNLVTLADAVDAGQKSGTYDIFDRPVHDPAGTLGACRVEPNSF